MYGRVRPDATRDRLVGRLGILSRGTPIAAALAVVGIGAVAAISYPGKSSAGGATSQDAAATAAPVSGSGGTSSNSNAQNGVSTQQGATPTVVAPTTAPVPVGGRRGQVSSGGS